jgi:hypothetical protein
MAAEKPNGTLPGRVWTRQGRIDVEESFRSTAHVRKLCF